MSLFLYVIKLTVLSEYSTYLRNENLVSSLEFWVSSFKSWVFSFERKWFVSWTHNNSNKKLNEYISFFFLVFLSQNMNISAWNSNKLTQNPVLEIRESGIEFQVNVNLHLTSTMHVWMVHYDAYQFSYLAKIKIMLDGSTAAK